LKTNHPATLDYWSINVSESNPAIVYGGGFEEKIDLYNSALQ
jgi:hypothetical protein